MIERALRAFWGDLRLHLQSVFSVAVAFVCLGATVLLWVNVDGVRERMSEFGRLSVYLKTEADPEAVLSIRQALAATPGVSDVVYLSAEQARSDVLMHAQDEALSSLPIEAFPASLEIKLDRQGGHELSEKLKNQLGSLPSVEAVETYEAWGERLHRLLSGGVSAALLLAAVVLLAVMSVVGSTMRMALARRRTEVEVLKMVGATDSYVRGPFVLEGAAQGAAGAGLALSFLGVLYLILRDAFDGALTVLTGVNPRFLPPLLVLCLVLLGAAIGAMSAFFSLRRLIASLP